MGEVNDTLGFCPYCNVEFPRGPAYFCPKCGKKLDEKFSKRDFFSEKDPVISTDNYNTAELESSEDNDAELMVEESEQPVSKDDVSLDYWGDEYYNLSGGSKNKKEELSSTKDLVTINESLKLDLFLEECVEESFLKKLVKGKGEDYYGPREAVHTIMSSYNFDEIMDLRETNKTSFSKYDSIKLLEEAFKDLPIIEIITIARKYEISISVNRTNLIENFVDKLSFEELINILNENKLAISDILLKELITKPKSILEQIYDLDENGLKQCLQLTGDYSKESLISSLVNNLPNQKLLFKNKLDKNDIQEEFI